MGSGKWGVGSETIFGLRQEQARGGHLLQCFDLLACKIKRGNLLRLSKAGPEFVGGLVENGQVYRPCGVVQAKPAIREREYSRIGGPVGGGRGERSGFVAGGGGAGAVAFVVRSF